jgi:FkbM family methyltransferase
MRMHFIYLGGGFNYAYALAVLSAANTQKVQGIDLWCSEKPDGLHFDLVKQLVRVKMLEVPRFLSMDRTVAKPGTEKDTAWSKASNLKDYFAYKILYEEGGFVCDLDTLSLKDATGLLGDYDLVTPMDAPPGTIEFDHGSSMFLGKKGTPPIKELLTTTEHIFKQPWEIRFAAAGPVLVTTVAHEWPGTVRGVNFGFLGGLTGYEAASIYEESPFELPRDCYILHMFSFAWKDKFRAITPEWVAKSNSLYARLARKVCGLHTGVIDLDAADARADARRMSELELLDVTGGSKMYFFRAGHWITPEIRSHQVYEPGTTEYLKKNLKTGQVFVDVGAHVGYFTVLASKLVGSTGKVYAFEPSAINFPVMMKNIELNKLTNVVAINAAASDKDGASVLYGYGSKYRGLASMFPDRMVSWHHEHEGKIDPDGSSETIKTMRLDAYLSSNGIKPDMLKIDVEGAEAEVVEGLGSFVGRVPIIFLEDFTGPTKTRLLSAGYKTVETGWVNKCNYVLVHDSEPKILHFIVTGDEFPYQYYLAVRTAQKTQKVDKVKVWQMERVTFKDSRYYDLLNVEKGELKRLDVPAFVGKDAHYIRSHTKDYYTWNLLLGYGGFCFDCDTLSFADITGYLGDKEALICGQYLPNTNPWNSAFVGAVQNSYVANAAYLNASNELKNSDMPWGATGPGVATSLVEGYPDKVEALPVPIGGSGTQKESYNDLFETEDVANSLKLRVVHLYAASGRFGHKENYFARVTPQFVDSSQSSIAKAVRGVLTKDEYDPFNEAGESVRSKDGSFRAWKDAQAWESKWWEEMCINSLNEELKQLVYAGKMGLDKVPNEKTPYRYDVHGKSVLDVGSGPVSILLKCANYKKAKAIDPIKFPLWVCERYKAAGVEYECVAAEVMNESEWDEVWIYNVLQHVRDPKEVIRKAKAAGRLVRLFEWVDLLPCPGHPWMLTEVNLNEWLKGEGKVEVVAGACSGKAYFGIFKGDGYGKV